jgi:hypothetical protein
MRTLLVIALMAGLGVAVAAQEPFADRLPLSNAPGVWSVEVVTTGGFTGRGAGNFAVRADGATACTAPITCSSEPANRIDSLVRALAGATTTAWTRPANAGRCFDCITTTLTVRRRVEDGTISTSTFSWNVVDLKDIPADVRSVYDAAMSLTRRGR